MAKPVGILSASVAVAVVCTQLWSGAGANVIRVGADVDALRTIASSLLATLTAAGVASETAEPVIDGEQDEGETHTRVPSAPAIIALGCLNQSSHIDDFFVRPDLPPKVCAFIA